MINTSRLDKISLAEQAYNQIRGLILDQVIEPDHAIGIDAIALKLGVSQTPIREALARLEGDGLVVRLRSGRYNSAPKMSRKAYGDLYQIRLLLEPAASALAAARRSDAAANLLEQSVRQLASAGTGTNSLAFVNFVDADSLFHTTISNACGNDFISTSLKQLQPNHRISPIYRDRGVFDADSVIREHARIAQAIKAGDAAGAESAMKAHVERSRDDILAWLDHQH
jgi:DNA-binding GntR family transcriptional regulator